MAEAGPNTLAARRANFLSGTRTVLAREALNAELGEENASQLMAKIGEQLVAAGLRRDSVALDSALLRITGQLNASEKLAMAAGGVMPPRVMGLVQEESAKAGTASAARPSNEPSAVKAPEPSDFDRYAKAKTIHATGTGNGPSVGLGANSDSPNRFDVLKLSVGERAAFDLAESLGMKWAMGNKELLRLGPAAIQTLHQAGVKGESFNRLTKDAGFSERNGVKLAKRLHDEGKTPEEVNEHFDKTAAASKAVAGSDPKAQKAFQDLHMDVVNAKTPEARATAWEKMKTLTRPAKAEPEKRKDVERYEDMMRQQLGVEAEAMNRAHKKDEIKLAEKSAAEVKEVRADTESIKRDAAVATAQAKANMFDESSSPAAAPSGAQPGSVKLAEAAPKFASPAAAGEKPAATTTAAPAAGPQKQAPANKPTGP